MTDVDLDAIEARANAATPGPWWRARYLRPPTVFAGDGSSSDLAVATVFEQADTEFIAHARQDVPALVAEVRKLRAALQATERTTP